MKNFLLKFKENPTKIIEDFIFPTLSSPVMVKTEASSKKM